MYAVLIDTPYKVLARHIAGKRGNSMKYKLIMDKGKMYALALNWESVFKIGFPPIKQFDYWQNCPKCYVIRSKSDCSHDFIAFLYLLGNCINLYVTDFDNHDLQLTWEPEAFPYFKWCLTPVDNYNDEP